MKNGLGCDVNCPTRPSPYGDFADTLPKSAKEIVQVILSMWRGFGEGLAIGIFCKRKTISGVVSTGVFCVFGEICGEGDERVQGHIAYLGQDWR